jgi:hypothetical protein
MPFVDVAGKERATGAQRARIMFYFAIAFALTVVAKAFQFGGAAIDTGRHTLVDFDDFHIVGQLVWQGEVAKAYHFATMSQIQQRFSGEEFFMPWTYPPQFDLLVAPLALLPLGLAYALFTSATLASWLAVLRRIAGEAFLSIVFLLIPTILITISCGQNGFLTGTLIGLTCIGLQRQRAWAGIPLGLMVVKPHLAVAFAVYLFVSRRWNVLIAAGLTVLLSSLLATALLGPEIWGSFRDGVREAGIFLEKGFYPFYRMISVYALLRTLGAPAVAAFLAQLIMAATAAAAVWTAGRRLPETSALGLTTMAALLFSPYAYDYDLPVLGVGLALLASELERCASAREKAALFGLCFVAGGWGLAHYALRLIPLFVFGVRASDAEPGGLAAVALGGLATIALCALCWRILWRSRQPAAAPVPEPA